MTKKEKFAIDFADYLADNHYQRGVNKTTGLCIWKNEREKMTTESLLSEYISFKKIKHNSSKHGS